MAILKAEEVHSSQGFEKVISKEGMGIAMDILQKSQYSRPLPSTVRETASNAVDSVREKQTALKILSGEAKVEDFYEVKEGDVYKASEFTPSYFNPDYLSDNNIVSIRYYERDDEERDLLQFIDQGVGLGGSRLEGFFELAYSTKRLNKFALGKWGLGNKSPLATGIQSYRMTSFYNGSKVVFDIFNHHIQSLVDQWDENGNNNELREFSNGFQYYAEKTEEKNGVIIELEVKKHQRSLVKEAIQDQLMYFTGIEFTIFHNGWEEEIPVSTEIYYEDDDLILSRNRLFTKPHIVLGQPGAQVNYGLIDFQELELSPKTGNVGIKVNNEEVEITPSREDIIWSPQTRDVLLHKFQKAQKAANQIVANELKEEDILKWITKSLSLWSNSNSGTNQILRQLSGIIDRANIKPIYVLDESIEFDTPKAMIGWGTMLRNVSFDTKYINNTQKLKISRTESDKWPSISSTNPLYVTRGSASGRKDAYIRSQGNYAFNLLSVPKHEDQYWIDLEAKLVEQYKTRMHTAENSTKLTVEEALAAMYPWTDEEKAAGVKRELDKELGEYQKALKFLSFAEKSSLYINYDEILVPSDWVDNVGTEADFDTNQTQTILHSISYADHQKRRREEGKVFFKYASWYSDANVDRNGLDFKWQGLELSAAELNNFDGTLVYTTQAEWLQDPDDPTKLVFDENSDEQKMKMISALLLNNAGTKTSRSQLDIDNSENTTPIKNYTTYNLLPRKLHHIGRTDDLLLLKVSKELAKKLTHFIPISKFLYDINDQQVIFTHPKIMNWFTAKKVYDTVKDLEFLKNFSEISPYHAREFNDLYEGAKAVYFDSWGRVNDYPKEMKDKFVDDLELISNFQEWISEEKPSKEDIADRALEDFGNAEIRGGLVLNLDLIKRARALQEWASPVINLLNNINYFRILYSKVNKSDKEEFLQSVRHFLRYKSVEIKELETNQLEENPVESEVEDEYLKDED